MGERYRLVPITGRAACDWIARTHRHLDAPPGALFAAAVAFDGEIVGAATTGNPPRVWMGTGRIVITRCAALAGLPPVGDHAAPVCTMLYGALCRASQALGYREAWTYTLPGEDGRSLRAAGFLFMGMTRGEEWSRPSRSRRPASSAAPKGRWMRQLAPLHSVGKNYGDRACAEIAAASNFTKTARAGTPGQTEDMAA